MPLILTADSSQITKSINVPLNGVDQVDQNSVDGAFKNLLDTGYYIAKSQIYEKPIIKMSSNAASVSILPFGGLWVSITSPNEIWVYLNNPTAVSLTAANLDTGGAFTTNTAYYIYAKSGLTPFIADFEISLTPPDSFKRFKGVDISRRYVGSFFTQTVMAAIQIVAFTMVGNRYILADNPAGATITTAAVGTVSLTYTPSTAGLPLTASTVLVNGRWFSGDPFTLVYGPTSVPYSSLSLNGNGVTAVNFISLEIALSSIGQFTFSLTNTVASSTAVSTTILGYTE